MIKKQMRLSKRLETVASFVPKGSNVVDIGTDHGYVPIYLIKQQLAAHAIAMDVGKGPLKRAAAHVQEYGLEDRIEVRLSDGLNALHSGEADCVVISGMGGELMIHILEEGRALWDSIAYLVLSPQSELFKVRRFLEKELFFMEKETMVEDEDKYYTIMGVSGSGINSERKGATEPGREIDYRYGRLLIQHKSPVLLEYLLQEQAMLEGVLGQMSGADTVSANARRAGLYAELAWNKEAQKEMKEVSDETE